LYIIIAAHQLDFSAIRIRNFRFEVFVVFAVEFFLYNLRMKNSMERANNRLIGILGGMGPEATLDFYRQIINLTPADKDQDHIRVLIYSNPKIPDRTAAIAGNGENPAFSLIESAKLLEKGGAGIIAMPCNSAHHYLPQLQREIKIPILDMVGETCRKLCEDLPGAKTAGLIAALGTVRSGVYHRALSKAGIRIVTPDDADQEEIQSAIAQVKAGRHNRSTREALQSIGKRLMEAGAGAVILGCTEIPLAFSSNVVDYPTLNSTRILAEVAVDWAFGRSG
jgi:aspartate racemase